MPKKPPSKSRLDAARERMYRELVFESAEHVFARKGFEAATMQEIAGEAGISLKTLYATFPGKQDLYEEIEQVRGIEFAEAVTMAWAASASVLENLAGGVRAYVEFLHDHPNFLRIHLREGRTWGLAPADADARENWARGVGGTAELVRAGQAEGLFYDGDPELMSMSAIALMQVQLARYAESIDAEDAEALAEEILVQLRRLLCKPGAPGADLAAA